MVDNIPDSWRLAFALDLVARQHGWIPAGRTTAANELTVIYRRDPLIELIDALPEEDRG